MVGAPHSTPHRRPRPGGGFSLVELIATLVVVAVIAAVAVPTASSLGASRAATAARQLLRDLTFARQRAMSTGVRAWVVFDTGAKTWSVLGEDPSNPGRAGATVLTDPATGVSYVTTLDAGEYVDVDFGAVAFDGQPEVGFDWLGRPLNSTETDLAAAGSAVISGGWTVTVARETGLATCTP